MHTPEKETILMVELEMIKDMLQRGVTVKLAMNPSGDFLPLFHSTLKLHGLKMEVLDDGLVITDAHPS